jgi:NitT/TauT family transport system substrate-binding protein
LIPSVRHRATTLLALSALVLASWGCRDEADRELIPLRVGYTRHLTMAPILIAQAQGLFEEEGLDVELIAFESASVALPSLLRGRLDVLPGPVSTALFNAVSRGGRLRIVGDKGAYDGTQCSHQALVRSIAGTAGEDPPVLERVSTANEHFMKFFVERALEEHGYDPSSIEMYSVPQAAEYDAVVAGRLDAAFIGEPWLTRVLEAEGGEVMTWANDLFDQYQYSVIVYGPSLLDESPEVGERFAVAFLRGLRAFNEGKTEANLKVLVEGLGQSHDDLTGFCWPSMGTDGFIQVESLMDFQRWAMERGDLDVMVEPEDFWEPRFMERANEILADRAR